MKKIITILVLATTLGSFSQIQENTPWAKKIDAQHRGKKASELTLEEISKSAEAYFATIDKNKKGSGLKPFERWKYHWSFYTDKNGKIKPAKSLWKAWEAKNRRNSTETSRRTDVSNWQSIGPSSHTNTASWSSGQGRVNTVVIDPNNPNTYYVGAPAGGIWKSVDSGSSWSTLVDHLPQIGVSGIAIDPSDSNTIYIATGDDDSNDSYSVGVWKSTDGGANWSPTGSISANSMNDIYIHPTNTQTLLVATSTGVYKTIDGGANWNRVRTGNIIDLKMKPGDPSVWYAATSNTVFRSSNGGDSFTAVSIPTLSGSGRLVLDVSPANPDYVYLLSSKSVFPREFNGLYRSTDSGVTFTKMAETDNILESSQAYYDLALGVSDTDENTVFVGCLNVWKTTNGGDNFSKINNWNAPNSASYTHGDIHFLRYSQGKLLAGTDGGFYQSIDDGASFTDLTNNMEISQFYKIAVAAQNSGNVVGGLQDNGGFAYSNNRWNVYHGADGMDNAIDKSNPNTYHGFIQYGGRLYTTTDGGLTRNSGLVAPSAETGTNDSGGEWVTPLVSDSTGKLYAGYKKLYKLENNAWIATSSFQFSDDIDHITIDPSNDNNIFIAQSGSLYKSTDAGVNISNVSSFSGGTINGIEVNPNDPNTIWVITNNNVLVSNNINDTNPTFQTVGMNLPSESIFTIKYHNRSGTNALYIGTALGVYYINDTETDWQVFDNNLPNVAVRDLAINEIDSKIYAGTYGRGVFVSSIPRVLPENDVRLLSINNPSNGSINCNTNLTPEITIKNEGEEDITSLNLDYSYDGGTQNTFTWTGDLASEETTTISLPNETLSLGNHNITITANLTGDAYADNNTQLKTFLVNSLNTTPTTVNAFENNSDELLTTAAGADVWERGSINKTLIQAPSGNAYSTKLTGNYPDNTIGYLYTNCYNLTTLNNPELAFKMGFDIEQDWDYMVVEYSTNQGESWEILGASSDANWYNSSSTSNGLPGKQWTGEGEDINSSDNLSNATVKDYSYSLAAFTNEESIIFRFKFAADAAANEEGVVIDDLLLNGVLSVDNFNLLNNIAIYPNPSESIFNLNWNTGDALNIKVYDITGKQIFTKKNITNNSYQLDLSGYAQGIYLLNMNMNGKTATKKLILK